LPVSAKLSLVVTAAVLLVGDVATATLGRIHVVGGAASAAPKWCGERGSDDWICAVKGSVAVTPPANAGTTQLPLGRIQKVEPRTAVRVDPASIARLTFTRQALCRLGPAGSPTHIVTRYAGGGARLYRQDTGISWCSFARKPRSLLPFFCSKDEECPVIVTATGSRVVIYTSNPVVIDVCAGSIHVRVEQDGTVAEATASASSEGRYRVTIRQTQQGIDLRVERFETRGACTSRVFREQERALGG
jgi:hypothetical protein